MKAVLKKAEERMNRRIDHLNSEFAAIRAGRANPAVLDKVLVDAPCSGEGMFRKDPDMIKAWDTDSPKKYAAMQKDIVKYAVLMLAPGGYLLYSTCTFSPEEDEQVVAWLLDHCPEMELCEIPSQEGFLPGRPEQRPDELS